MVFAVEVVVVQVTGQVAAQAAEADLEIAGKCRAPALLGDRAVQALDMAVGLWAPRANPCVRDTVGQPGAELAAAELGVARGE